MFLNGLGDVFRALDKERVKDLREWTDDALVTTREAPVLGEKDLVRASGMYKFCPRLEALKIKHDKPLSETISAKLNKTFDFGRAFEVYFRDEKLGNLGLVIGKWQCQECGFTPERYAGAPRYKKPDTCPKCGQRGQFRYREEEKTDERIGLRGHCDGFLYWGNEYSILEMKTANDHRFKTVKKQGRPFDDHVAQVQVYMRMYGYDKALIWYFNKDSSDDLTFWVNHDKEYSWSLFQRIVDFREFFKTGVVPKGICVTKEDDKAKKCDLCELCFADQGVVANGECSGTGPVSA